MSRSRRRRTRGRVLLWLTPLAAVAGRDQECAGGAESLAEPTCSSIVQTPDAFMDALGAY